MKQLKRVYMCTVLYKNIFFFFNVVRVSLHLSIILQAMLGVLPRPVHYKNQYFNLE